MVAMPGASFTRGGRAIARGYPTSGEGSTRRQEAG